MSGLKPCPFCGGDAEIILTGNDFIGYSKSQVRCKRCGVGRIQRYMRKKHDGEWIERTVTEHWNQRV